MLQLRPNCEHCNKDLPPNSTSAKICSYECTFCTECAEVSLKNVCPNCGGGFHSRPVKPKDQLDKNPPSDERIIKPADLTKHAKLFSQVGNTNPEFR